MSILSYLENKIYEFKIKNTKGGFITIDEIQARMRNHQNMPTAVFHATKTDYIVKTSSIHGPKIKKRSRR